MNPLVQHTSLEDLKDWLGGGRGAGSNSLFWKFIPQADGSGEEGNVVAVSICMKSRCTEGGIL